MSLPATRHVAALTGDGRITLLEQPVPALREGAVLVQVHASLVSPGTELGGWRQLAAQRDACSAGARSTLPAPKPFGYSNAGVVVAAGSSKSEFAPGDRVACIGAGYALHTDVAVVPHHLCVRLPDPVSFAQGAYAMLAATAMHALRRGQPEFGESCAVVGLGLVGQLSASLYQLAGNEVIGWDSIPFRCEVARRRGIRVTATVGAEDEVAATEAFTRGAGLDAAVLAFGGDATKAVDTLERCFKRTPDGHRWGRLVVVGGCTFQYPSRTTNLDVRRASRTGYGYHYEAWEYGAPYPPVAMRWTTRTNLELCMRLIAERRLEVDALTTHTISLAAVETGVAAILDEPDRILGVVLTSA
ncbi:MAG: hypothetical protein GX557_13860 [Chloroflexi bacterium]|nr:hypothetical protein [Chloroflexota bacterium]